MYANLENRLEPEHTLSTRDIRVIGRRIRMSAVYESNLRVAEHLYIRRSLAAGFMRSIILRADITRILPTAEFKIFE